MYGTIVFCTLKKEQEAFVTQIAVKHNLAYDQWSWVKPDMAGKSHIGGFRQADSTERIVTVYLKREGVKDLSDHYVGLRRHKDAGRVRFLPRVGYGGMSHGHWQFVPLQT